MLEPLASLQNKVVKRCPGCSRINASSSLCLYCLQDITGAPSLGPDEVEAALSEAPILRGNEGEHWLTVRKGLLLGTLALVVLFTVWLLYGIFISKPVRPDVPASTARSAASGGSAWSTQDGDIRGMRSTTAPAHVGGSEAWRVSLGAPIATALVTDGKFVVATVQDGRLVALDASSGKTLWTTTLSLNNPPLAAPVITGDRIYLGQREGLLFAFNAADGEEMWRWKNPEGSFESSPLVVDGVVYVFSTDGLFAFDSENGRILWKNKFSGSYANVSPIVEGPYLLIVASDKAIVFNRETGERALDVSFSRAQPLSIAIRDGHAVVVNGRTATAFDASLHNPWWERVLGTSIRGGETIRSFWFRMYLNGMAPAVPLEQVLWDINRLPRRMYAAAVGHDLFVVTGRDGAVSAFNRFSGQPVWTAKVNMLVAAPIITGDGVLLTEEDRLVLLDPATGKQNAERKVEGMRSATPVESATYIGTLKGDVIALR
ncbi:MAG: hypothetical protein EXR68_06135 [Dehalococcoidia bacterium]|nr:hypothetical protein [Dehalococcoidia bacterium]